MTICGYYCLHEELEIDWDEVVHIHVVTGYYPASMKYLRIYTLNEELISIRERDEAVRNYWNTKVAIREYYK